MIIIMIIIIKIIIIIIIIDVYSLPSSSREYLLFSQTLILITVE